MSVAKLDGTTYRLWAMRMTETLQRQGLWNLVNGHEELLEKPEKEESDKDKPVKEYKTKMVTYEKQDLRMQKASGMLKMAMTDATAIHYYNEMQWTTASSIWLDAHANYQTPTSYHWNHLQREL